MDDSKFRSMGILGLSALSDEEREAEERAETSARHFAQLNLAGKEIRALSAGAFQGLLLFGELAFERRLYEFAVEQNIRFRDGNWQDGALRMAGRLYLDNLARKRPRGRPSHQTGKGMGGVLQLTRPLDRNTADFFDVEAQMKAAETRGEEISQWQACQLVAFVRQERDGKSTEPGPVELVAKSIERRVGAYRRMAGVSLKSGRAKRLKKKGKKAGNTEKK